MLIRIHFTPIATSATSISTSLAAVFDVFPVASPLLPPRKLTLAMFANFLRQVQFVMRHLSCFPELFAVKASRRVRVMQLSLEILLDLRGRGSWVNTDIMWPRRRVRRQEMSRMEGPSRQWYQTTHSPEWCFSDTPMTLDEVHAVCSHWRRMTSIYPQRSASHV